MVIRPDLEWFLVYSTTIFVVIGVLVVLVTFFMVNRLITRPIIKLKKKIQDPKKSATNQPHKIMDSGRETTFRRGAFLR